MKRNKNLIWCFIFIVVSLVGMTLLSLLGYFLSALLWWVSGAEFEFNMATIITSIKIGVFGGGIVGLGVVLMRFFNVKGF